jgi:hypothetical protein
MRLKLISIAFFWDLNNVKNEIFGNYWNLQTGSFEIWWQIKFDAIMSVAQIEETQQIWQKQIWEIKKNIKIK